MGEEYKNWMLMECSGMGEKERKREGDCVCRVRGRGGELWCEW